MIYLGTLLLCIFLTWMYDVLGYTQNKWHWYYLLLVWFVLVSGFQYMVGSDMPVYVESYEKDFNHISINIDELGGRFQPGWLLLSYCCRQVTDDFVFFKLIQAIFVNVAIFSFFKRESKYLFLCITLYALTSYLVLNFNALRQSFAIGFVLYFISFIKRRRYILSFVFLFMAFMFHNSAFLALIIPLFSFLKYNKKVFLVLGIIVIGLFIFMIKMDADAMLNEMIDSGLLGDNLTELGSTYVNSDNYGARGFRIGIIIGIRLMLVLFSVLYYIKKEKDFFFGGIGFVYFFLLLFSWAFPITMRFRLYFDFVFYILLSVFLIEMPQGKLWQVRRVLTVLLFVVYFHYSYQEYMSKYEGSPYRYIDQYYPYISVFNSEDVDSKKINFFKSF